MTRRRKSWLVLAMTAMLALPGLRSAEAAAGFKDTGSHWARGTIEWAASKGIVDGYADGTFKPDNRVSEPEFLAMLIRAFPEAGSLSAPKPGEAWYFGYYALARSMNWAVLNETTLMRYNRGHVAQLMASAQGQKLGLTASIQYLLDHRLSEGKTSATVEGYAAADPLTRAEALQFLRNAADQGLALKEAESPAAAGAIQVRGISLGDSADEVTDKLGQPDRKDVSKYGFEWLVYNQDLYQYTQVGVRDGQVVGLYTSGSDWSLPQDVKPALARADVGALWGAPLEYIKKGNTRFMLQQDNESDVYQRSGAYVTFYYDIHEGSVIDGVQIISEQEEGSLESFYGATTEPVRRSFEREIFDLANAARVKRGLEPFIWNDRVSDVARLHSEDMAAQSYFDHTNPAGEGPSDRAVVAGLKYRLYGENIAAGQTDAFSAHHGWMNSPGHRRNLLSDARELGTGVFFGGDMQAYYTQNFYTPY